MARHVRIGSSDYQSLAGAPLLLVGAWDGRVPSFEALVTALEACLRSSGFRPFRPRLTGRLHVEGEVAARLTGIHDTRVNSILPWKPRLISSLLSIDIAGRLVKVTTKHKTPQGSSLQTDTSMWDLTITISGGAAVLKNGRWSTASNGAIDDPIPEVVESVLSALSGPKFESQTLDFQGKDTFDSREMTKSGNDIEIIS